MRICSCCKFDRNNDSAEVCFLCLSNLNDSTKRLEKIDGEWIYVNKDKSVI